MKRRDFAFSTALAGLLPRARAGHLPYIPDPYAPPPEQQPHYKLVRLDPSDASGSGSAAFAVSANRKAAGYVRLNIAGGYRPALFFPGDAPKVIYTDGPGQARGINSRIEVVGWFNQGTTNQAFRYRNDTLETLPSLGGGSSYATAINNRSEIVGWSEAAPGALHAVCWAGNQIIDLGTWGSHAAQATALNDRGDIVGFREVVVEGRALRQGVLLRRGQSPQLMPVPPGYLGVVPTAINSRGDVTGYAYSQWWVEQARVAFVYANGQYTLMPQYSGFPTAGLSINSRGEVVGLSFDGPADPRNFATLWVNNGTTRMFQQNLIDPADAELWRLMEAFAVNDAGVMVGHGYYRPIPTRTLIQAYMLIPVK